MFIGISRNLVELIKNPPEGKESLLLDLLTNRVPAGVDEAAYVKAAFLNEIALGTEKVSSIERSEATKLLGTMLGGYNIEPLVKLLEDDEVGDIAEKEGHHPDITFGWGYAKIQIFTHKINGLVESDFILAAKINKI